MSVTLKEAKTFSLTELHALINEVLSPQFQTSVDLRRMKCERLLEIMDAARGEIEREMSQYAGEKKEQAIRHTLDNTPLIPPDDEDEEERISTIHGEK